MSPWVSFRPECRPNSVVGIKELVEEFLKATDRAPNVIGVVICRKRTVREGAPYSDVTTRNPELC